MGKSSSKKGPKKEVIRKEKGPKPDYKIPKFDKGSYKEVYAKDIDAARARLVHAATKDKWIYYAEYRALKETRYNGGCMVIKHNSSVKKITY